MISTDGSFQLSVLKPAPAMIRRKNSFKPTDLPQFRLSTKSGEGQSNPADLRCGGGSMFRILTLSTAFLAGGPFDESRVVIAPSKQVSSEDGEWVTLELAVAPK